MTYQEAETVKSGLESNTIQFRDLIYRVLIVPRLEKDYDEYLEDRPVDLEDLEDDDAKEFSSNGKYMLVGLHYERNDNIASRHIVCIDGNMNNDFLFLPNNPDYT